MRVRRQTLEEWFLDLQLQSVKRDHFHIPFTVDLPCGPLVEAWSAHGRLPAAAVTVRAVAEVVRQLPALNRVLFRTLWGTRILELDRVHVNVPVLVEHGDRSFLSAVIVSDADQRSVTQIQDTLRAARERTLDDLPINRLFADGRDGPLRRLRLRLLHHVAYHVPQAWARSGAGAVGVSSLHHRRHADTHARAVSLGPTAMTALVLGVHGDPPRLHLGLTFDHALLGGDLMGEAIARLGDLFGDPPHLCLLP